MPARTVEMATAMATAGACVLALAACSASHGSSGPAHSGHRHSGHTPAGVVVGKYVREGGPLRPAHQRPLTVRLRGVVDFTSASGHRVRVKIGTSGTFSVVLAPGRYRVTGRTPMVRGAGSRPGSAAACSQPLSVTVASGHTSDITVACVVP